MLEELEILEEEPEEKERLGQFGPSKSRYRYVYELFMAALIYYTNKFGHDEGLNHARNTLFVWAYALRVKLLRVQGCSTLLS